MAAAGFLLSPRSSRTGLRWLFPSIDPRADQYGALNTCGKRACRQGQRGSNDVVVALQKPAQAGQCREQPDVQYK